MARFAGIVGMKEDPIETSPGIFEVVVTEKKVSGEIIYKPVRWTSGELSQDGVTVNHSLSILADASSLEDFSKAAYVEWQGVRWTVTAIDYRRPRIFLTLGGIYNG